MPTAAATKKDARHAIVPTSAEEWRILYAKWLQQAMLVLGLLPPDAAKVTTKISAEHSRMHAYFFATDHFTPLMCKK